MKKTTLFELLKTATYIGAVGYGGPAILMQMKKRIVDERACLSEEEFLESVSLAQILPGSTGVSVMSGIGFRLFGLAGGVLAPVFYVLPATIAMIASSWAYFRYGDLPVVHALFVGLSALVIALLVDATIGLGRTTLLASGSFSWRAFSIALFAFVIMFYFEMNVITMILVSGVLGLLLYHLPQRAYEKEPTMVASEHAATQRRALPPFEKKDLLVMLLMLGVFGALFFDPSLRSIMGTFLGIGAIAFGGGYSAIPIIQHQVVNSLHWLTLPEFLAGKALGQVTPGPVFITATFIGYRIAGILGGLVATLAVFAPSIALMIGLVNVHAKIIGIKAVRYIVNGFLAGFIGLLAEITITFGKQALVSWQTWFIFVGAMIWILYFKKNASWAIIATIAFSILFLRPF